LVPAGTHLVDFVVVEDRFWTWSNRMSWLVLCLWFAACCAAAAAEIRNSAVRRKAGASS